MTPVPAGWYPDPWYPGGVRWWDGYAWTPFAHTAYVGYPQPGSQRRPRPLLVAGAVILVVAAIFGVAGAMMGVASTALSQLSFRARSPGAWWIPALPGVNTIYVRPDARGVRYGADDFVVRAPSGARVAVAPSTGSFSVYADPSSGALRVFRSVATFDATEPGEYRLRVAVRGLSIAVGPPVDLPSGSVMETVALGAAGVGAALTMADLTVPPDRRRRLLARVRRRAP